MNKTAVVLSSVAGGAATAAQGYAFAKGRMPPKWTGLVIGIGGLLMLGAGVIALIDDG